MNAARLSVIALLVALASAGLGLFQAPVRSATRASDPTAVADRLATLERRLDALTEELARLRDGTLAPPVVLREPFEEPSPSAEPPASLDEGIAPLEERLEQLEARISERSHGSARERAEFYRRLQNKDADEPTLDEWTRIAQDPTSSEERKLSALRELRNRWLADGTDARLPILPEMIELARTSQDGRVRADVWRQLSHVTDPSLLLPLLDALAHDEYAEAREEAAETLADFLPDPSVETALTLAKDRDPDRGVREQAAASLARRRP